MAEWNDPPGKKFIHYYDKQITLYLIDKLLKHIKTPVFKQPLLNEWSIAKAEIEKSKPADSLTPDQLQIILDHFTERVKYDVMPDGTIANFRNQFNSIAEQLIGAGKITREEFDIKLKKVDSLQKLAESLYDVIQNTMDVTIAFLYAKKVRSYQNEVRLQLIGLQAMDGKSFETQILELIRQQLSELNVGKGKPKSLSGVGLPASAARGPLSVASLDTKTEPVRSLSVAAPPASGPSGLKTLHLEGADQVLLSTINENFTRLSEAIGKLKPKTKAAAVGGRLRATRRCLKA